MKVERGTEEMKILCNTTMANHICYMWGVAKNAKCVNITVLVGLPKSDESFLYCVKCSTMWSLIFSHKMIGPSCTKRGNRHLIYRINLLQQLFDPFMI